MYSDKEIVAYLKTLSVSHDHYKLLDCSLGRLLRKAAEQAEDWRMMITDEQSNVINQWLISCLNKNVSWLRHVDKSNRPMKLLKFTTIENLLNVACKNK